MRQAPTDVVGNVTGLPPVAAWDWMLCVDECELVLTATAQAAWSRRPGSWDRIPG